MKIPSFLKTLLLWITTIVLGWLMVYLIRAFREQTLHDVLRDIDSLTVRGRVYNYSFDKGTTIIKLDTGNFTFLESGTLFKFMVSGVYNQQYKTADEQFFSSNIRKGDSIFKGRFSDSIILIKKRGRYSYFFE